MKETANACRAGYVMKRATLVIVAIVAIVLIVSGGMALGAQGMPAWPGAPAFSTPGAL
jgi:hypothetical protein